MREWTARPQADAALAWAPAGVDQTSTALDAPHALQYAGAADRGVRPPPCCKREVVVMWRFEPSSRPATDLFMTSLYSIDPFNG